MSTYISLDLESTGLDPQSCQIIEIGAVLDDLSKSVPLEKLPSFHAYVLPYQGQWVPGLGGGSNLLTGEPFALAMNHEIISRIAKQEEQYTYLEYEELAEAFAKWVNSLVEDGYLTSTKITVAGKNFAGFDKLFLAQVPGWNDYVKIHHRSIDPAVLYWNPMTDQNLPSLEECLKRAGCEKSVSHTAVEDAKDVIRLIRAKFK